MHQFENFYHQHKNCTYRYPEIAKSHDKIRKITVTSKIPYLKLLIDGPWKEILEEVKAVDSMFVPHRDDGQTKGWSSLCLHGPRWDKTDAASIYPEFKNIPENQLPYTWTNIADLCPIAYNYFKNVFPYKSYMRLRFMKLDAGGYINPHHDGTGFMLGAVNISLNNPIGCEMVLEDIGVVPFLDTGSVMAFNNSYNHMVWNQSDEPRYHMIVHGQPDHRWSDIIIKSYDSAYQKYPELSKQYSNLD